jgi:hypothetical protein
MRALPTCFFSWKLATWKKTVMTPSACWLAAAVLCSGAALADDLLDSVRQCVNQSDDAKRLACYDSAAGRTKPGRNDDLGITNELLREEQHAAGISAPSPKDLNLTAEVRTVAQAAHGKFVVTLDNGQVWAQQEELNFPIAAGDRITIRQGMLGALYLAKTGQNLTTRVKRVR